MCFGLLLLSLQVALRTLGQVIESTGAVIEPYIKYPKLLPTVLSSLKGEQSWAVRREVHKVLGILGALDPHKFKLTEDDPSKDERLLLAAAAPDDKAEHKPTARGATGTEADKGNGGKMAANKDKEKDNAVAEMYGSNAPRDVSSGAPGRDATTGISAAVVPSMFPNPDDFYPTVAITALLRILRDNTLHQHHNMVVKAVMFIARSLGVKCAHFLPQIVPSFLQGMQQCEDPLRENFLQQLAVLVSIVKQFVCNYLEPIFGAVFQFWTHTSLLGLVLHAKILSFFFAPFFCYSLFSCCIRSFSTASRE